MKLRRISAWLFVSSFLCVALACAQGSYTATAGGASGSAIPASISAVLEPQGVQFSDAQGPVCEIWWRKGIPEEKNDGASADVLYSGLSVGELVGVLHFPAAAKDYRGQDIKPGYYTLRYALVPQDGNHMGVSSYRDFLLLIPVADDTTPNQNLSFDAVVKASRLTAGTGHPAVLMLDPPSQNASAKFPSAAQDDQGDWTMNVKLDVKTTAGAAAQLPFAVVLVGQYQG
ncbi:MAG: hypothetical protein ACRD4Q_14625 [Candidatus Acidiferrales bacterium]